MSGPDTAQPGRSPPPGAPQCLPSPRRRDRMGVLSGLPGLRGGQGLGVTGVTSHGQRRGRTHAWPSPYPRICGRARAAEALGRASGGPRPRPGAGVAGAHVCPAPPPARGLRGLLSARSLSPASGAGLALSLGVTQAFGGDARWGDAVVSSLNPDVSFSPNPDRLARASWAHGAPPARHLGKPT